MASLTYIIRKDGVVGIDVEEIERLIWQVGQGSAAIMKARVRLGKKLGAP